MYENLQKHETRPYKGYVDILPPFLLIFLDFISIVCHKLALIMEQQRFDIEEDNNGCGLIFAFIIIIYALYLLIKK